MEFINFHCHNACCLNNAVKVQSMSIDEFTACPNQPFVTVGIHPWDTGKIDIAANIQRIRSICGNPNVIGVGEIGLDRLKGAPLSEQKSIFEEQINIALELNKPVVIHCVRAWSELLSTTSAKKYSTLKKAIHGFRQKAEIARQLVDGGYYFSFGTYLINQTAEIVEVLRLVPISRIFFETDTSEIPINEVYASAAQILNVPLEQLVDQIKSNFDEFFQNQSLL